MSSVVPSPEVSGTCLTAPPRGGRYLTFALGKEEFGLQILKVREIIGMMEITQLPCASAHVKGVINLRGQVIPVIDLRHRFDMPTGTTTDQTCIIVTEARSRLIDDLHPGPLTLAGIIVDRVSEVLSIPDPSIEDAPELSQSLESRFILGMGKVGTSVKILLDIDEVLKNSQPLPVESAA